MYKSDEVLIKELRERENEFLETSGGEIIGLEIEILKDFILSQRKEDRANLLDEIGKLADEGKMAKEATRINPTGADLIFLYDLKLILTILKEQEV